MKSKILVIFDQGEFFKDQSNFLRSGEDFKTSVVFFKVVVELF